MTVHILIWTAWNEIHTELRNVHVYVHTIHNDSESCNQLPVNENTSTFSSHNSLKGKVQTTKTAQSL